jgi:hypothetical protein
VARALCRGRVAGSTFWLAIRGPLRRTVTLASKSTPARVGFLLPSLSMPCPRCTPTRSFHQRASRPRELRKDVHARGRIVRPARLSGGKRYDVVAVIVEGGFIGERIARFGVNTKTDLL